MTPTAKPKKTSFLKRLLAFAVICAFTPILVFGATVAATGTVQVSVREKGPDGTHLWIPVPAIFFDAALFAAPRLIPPEDMADIRADIEPFLPAMRQLAQAIDDLPNATLVEVESPGEHVKIAKRYGSFHIDVHDRDSDVHVQLPARLASRALGIFG